MKKEEKAKLEEYKLAAAKKINTLMALLFTLFNHVASFTVAVTLLAPFVLDGANGILPLSTPLGLRILFLLSLLAIFPIASLVTTPVLTPLFQKMGRKSVLIWALGISSAALAFTGVAVLLRSASLLLVMRAVSGATAALMPTVQSAILGVSTDKIKTHTLSYIGLTLGLAWAIGPFLGGKLADPHFISWFGFSTPFLFLSLLQLANLLWVSSTWQDLYQIQSKRTGYGYRDQLQTIKRFLELPKLEGVLKLFALFSIAMFLFLSLFPLFLVQKFHFDVSEIGDLVALFGLFWTIGAFFLPKIQEKWGDQKKLIYKALLLSGFLIFISLLISRPVYFLIVLPPLALGIVFCWAQLSNMMFTAVNKSDQERLLYLSPSLQALFLLIALVLSLPLLFIGIWLPLFLSAIIFISSLIFYYYKILLK